MYICISEHVEHLICSWQITLCAWSEEEVGKCCVNCRVLGCYGSGGRHVFTDEDIMIQVFSGTSAVAPQWERCTARASSSLGFAIGAMFVDQTYKPSDKVLVSVCFILLML